MGKVFRAARVAAGMALLGVGIVAFAVLLLPKLFGWNAYMVTSGSMTPTFGAGAVVVAAPVEARDVAVDDIVTFVDSSGGFSTHRVVGMTAASVAGEESLVFTTKGDANEEADPTPLDPRNVVGKAAFAVPHLGYVVELVKAPVGAGLLAALFLFVVFSGGTDSKRDPKHAAKETPEREAVAVT